MALYFRGGESRRELIWPNITGDIRIKDDMAVFLGANLVEERTTQGRCLEVERSVKGKGTSKTSPGSKCVIHRVTGIFPECK